MRSQGGPIDALHAAWLHCRSHLAAVSGGQGATLWLSEMDPAPCRGTGGPLNLCDAAVQPKEQTLIADRGGKRPKRSPDLGRVNAAEGARASTRGEPCQYGEASGAAKMVDFVWQTWLQDGDGRRSKRTLPTRRSNIWRRAGVGRL
jgi:hypothetical protein